MTQTPRKKRKLPSNVTELPDREVMEKLFGKLAMKKVDALVAKRSEPEGVASQGDTISIETKIMP